MVSCPFLPHLSSALWNSSWVNKVFPLHRDWRKLSIIILKNHRASWDKQFSPGRRAPAPFPFWNGFKSQDHCWIVAESSEPTWLFVMKHCLRVLRKGPPNSVRSSELQELRGVSINTQYPQPYITTTGIWPSSPFKSSLFLKASCVQLPSSLTAPL